MSQNCRHLFTEALITGYLDGFLSRAAQGRAGCGWPTDQGEGCP